jgi:hypothetical protein
VLNRLVGWTRNILGRTQSASRAELAGVVSEVLPSVKAAREYQETGFDPEIAREHIPTRGSETGTFDFVVQIDGILGNDFPIRPFTFHYHTDQLLTEEELLFQIELDLEVLATTYEAQGGVALDAATLEVISLTQGG